MGLLDPLFGGVADLLDAIDGFFEAITNPSTEEVQGSQVVGDVIEEAQPFDEAVGTGLDAVEEAILSDLRQAGDIKEGDASDVADDTEETAFTALLTLGSAGTILEALGLGQLDGQHEYIIQALAGLGIDDVTGLELEARVGEGLKPALNQEIRQEHRTKQPDLQDYAEAKLRQKAILGTPQDADLDVAPETIPWTREQDFGWLQLPGRYGIRPDSSETLELAALSAADPEQLFEELPQAGLVPSEEAVEAVNALSGFPEVLKEEYRRMQRATTDRSDLWEQQTQTGDLVQELTTRVQSGEIGTAEALQRIPEENEPAFEALGERFDLHQSLPPKAPSASDHISAFTQGYIDESTLRERLDREELDTSQYPGILKAEIVSELDGDLQEALATGRITQEQYAQLAADAGLDDESIALLQRGRSYSDIVEAKLEGATDPAELPTQSILGIGPARSDALAAAGIETVGTLAVQDPEELAEEIGVTPESALLFIARAQNRVEEEKE